MCTFNVWFLGIVYYVGYVVLCVMYSLLLFAYVLYAFFVVVFSLDVCCTFSPAAAWRILVFNNMSNSFSIIMCDTVIIVSIILFTIMIIIISIIIVIIITSFIIIIMFIIILSMLIISTYTFSPAAASRTTIINS